MESKNQNYTPETVKIEVNVLGLLKSLADLASGLKEIVANAYDACLAAFIIGLCKVMRIDVLTYRDDCGVLHLAVANNGIPIEAFTKVLKLGNPPDMDPSQVDSTTNHLRSVGLKLLIAALWKKPGIIEIGTIKEINGEKKYLRLALNGIYTSEDNNRTITPDVLDCKLFPYAKMNTYFDITVTDESVTKEAIEETASAIAKKCLYAFLKYGDKLEITINGKAIVPKFHTARRVHEQKKESFAKYIVGHYVAKKLRRGEDVAVVKCPAINGVAEISICDAGDSADSGDTNSSETKGLFLYCNDLEFDAGTDRYISQRSSYNKKGEFKGIPNGRFELNKIAVYVNFKPGPGIIMPLNGQKNKMDLRTEIGKALRSFVDDTVGEVFRNLVAAGDEANARKAYDDAFSGIHKTKNSNMVFVRNVTFKDTHGTVLILDAAFVRQTRKNEDKLKSYTDPKGENYGKNYPLDETDIAGIIPEEGNRIDKWVYDLQIVEYKAVKDKEGKYIKQVTYDNVDQCVRYVKLISKVFGLDKGRIPVVLFGTYFSADINEYKESYLEEGFNIEFQEYGMTDSVK